VLTALALTAAVAHPGGPGLGFGLFFLIPLFWILLIVVLFAVFGRRWRRGGHGPWGAQSVLAQRYANGDIDEKEYRARLEVLRATTSR
jgi:putative membrane protein